MLRQRLIRLSRVFQGLLLAFYCALLNCRIATFLHIQKNVRLSVAEHIRHGERSYSKQSPNCCSSISPYRKLSDGHATFDTDRVRPPMQHHAPHSPETFLAPLQISDRAAIEQLGLNAQAVSSLLVEIFAEMVFCHAWVHADPHPGNILVRRVGTASKPRAEIGEWGTSKGSI